MNKKRKVTRALEEEHPELYQEVMDESPLMVFAMGIITEVSDVMKDQMIHEADIETQNKRIAELMARIQAKFNDIYQTIDTIEENNRKIDANIATMEFIISGSKTRH